MRAMLKALLGVGVFGALVWFERRRPLRSDTKESKLVRNARNLTMAALSAGAIQFIEQPLIQPLARRVARRRRGLLNRFKLPERLELLLAVVLLDYTLYIWHMLTHRAPFLWRFHSVHHVDLDLDASTALRFHFGEIAVSVLWRAGQVMVIGVSPRSLAAWQTMLALSIMFHHSNVRLPISVERKLCRLIVTPRMHGIHHSIVPEEVNSNWSSGLTLWDWLHGTLKLNVRQQEITIGVAAIRDPEEAGLAKMLRMPFEHQRDLLRLAGGERPTRPPANLFVHLLPE
jgi:sterol desaturase/sphingolipid hydroxylase (fatty acid hydroxylase superfamily)